MSATTPKLTLIANPKTHKDRENNKAYYQEKFFSKKQKEQLKETKRKEDIAWKDIGVRQQNGTNGCLSAGVSKNNKCVQKQNWEYTKESLKIFHANLNNLNVNTSKDDCEKGLPLSSELNASIVPEIVSIKSTEVVDSWEDLY
jgi:hypothetical protein